MGGKRCAESLDRLLSYVIAECVVRAGEYTFSDLSGSRLLGLPNYTGTMEALHVYHQNFYIIIRVLGEFWLEYIFNSGYRHTYMTICLALEISCDHQARWAALSLFRVGGFQTANQAFHPTSSEWSQSALLEE